jgi:hypothetical protein
LYRLSGGNYPTLLCAIGSGCFVEILLCWQLALLPEPPDGSDDEAPQAAVSFSTCLALRDSSQVDLSGRQVVCLSQSDSVDDGVEPSIAASVQAVAYTTRRGSFQGANASVSGQLSVGREAQAGSKDASKGSRRELVYTAEPCEWSIPGTGERLDFGLQVPGLIVGQPQALGEAAYRRCPDLLERRVARGPVDLEGSEAGPSLQTWEMILVRGIDLQEESMDLIL